MEPASALTTIALGVATLLPPAQIEKPVELYLHLANCDNKTERPICFEQVNEWQGRIDEESKRLLLTITPGTTAVNREINFKQISNTPLHDYATLRFCVRLRQVGDYDESLRLRFNRFIAKDMDNVIEIHMSWHRHTRQVTASCTLFDKRYVWNPHESLRSIHLAFSGFLAGEGLKDSQLMVQEIRCDYVPTLVELVLCVIHKMICDGKVTLPIVKSRIPADLHQRLEGCIEHAKRIKQTSIVLHY